MYNLHLCKTNYNNAAYSPFHSGINGIEHKNKGNR